MPPRTAAADVAKICEGLEAPISVFLLVACLRARTRSIFRTPWLTSEMKPGQARSWRKTRRRVKWAAARFDVLNNTHIMT